MQRTDDQVKQAELFYKKVDAIESRKNSSLRSQSDIPSYTDISEVSTRPSVKTIPPYAVSKDKEQSSTGPRRDHDSLSRKKDGSQDLERPYENCKGDWVYSLPNHTVSQSQSNNQMIKEAPQYEETPFKNSKGDWVYSSATQPVLPPIRSTRTSRQRDMIPNEQDNAFMNSKRGLEYGCSSQTSTLEISSSSELSSVSEEGYLTPDREQEVVEGKVYKAVGSDDNDAIEPCGGSSSDECSGS